jgi:hypothetical protein
MIFLAHGNRVGGRNIYSRVKESLLLDFKEKYLTINKDIIFDIF